MNTTEAVVAPVESKSVYRRLVDFASSEHHLVGASVYRLLVGVFATYQYVTRYAARDFLFAPNGVFPLTAQDAGWNAFVDSRSIYTLSTSHTFFEVMFHIGFLLAVLFMIGFKTRWVTPLLWLFYTSLQFRNHTLNDGGDNVTSILLVYTMFANLSEHFSVDAWLRKRSGKTRTPSPIAGIFHNTAILASAIQICIVYFVAGICKVQGEVWRNGTAIYYALSTPEFMLPGVSNHIFKNGIVIAILSYSTVVFQISFPYLVFMGRSYHRVILLLVAISFHLGIALVMGLMSFAGYMLAADLLILTDSEYQRIGTRLLSVAGAVARRFRRTTAAPQLATG